MLENAIERILSYAAKSWYLQSLVSIIAIYSFIIISISKGELKFRKISQLYFASISLLFLGADILYGFEIVRIRRLNEIIELANNAFNMIEAYVLLYFLREIIGSQKRKKHISVLVYLNIIMMVFGFAILLGTKTKMETYRWSTLSTVLHFYLITLACIWYFLDIYRSNREISMRYIPVVIAVLAYSLVSIPFLALAEMTYVIDYANSINAIHYMLLIMVCLSLLASQKTREHIISKVLGI